MIIELVERGRVNEAVCNLEELPRQNYYANYGKGEIDEIFLLGV